MKSSSIQHATFTTLAILVLALLTGCLYRSTGLVDHPLAKPAVDRLLSSDEVLQKEALVELANLGEGAMPQLAARFEEATPQIRLKILELSVTIAEPHSLVEAVFTQAAKDQTTAVRYAAATSAMKLLQHADALSPVMRLLLADPSPDIRAAALTTLSSFPGPYQPEPEELLRLLRDKHSMVAATAANLAIKRREPYVQAGARAALPRLIGALHDIHPSTRAACLFSIGQFGLLASPAVGPISEVLATDPVPEVRLQAALSLLRIGTPEAADTAREALRAFAKHPDPVISNAAKAAI